MKIIQLRGSWRIFGRGVKIKNKKQKFWKGRQGQMKVHEIEFCPTVLWPVNQTGMLVWIWSY